MKAGDSILYRPSGWKKGIFVRRSPDGEGFIVINEKGKLERADKCVLESLVPLLYSNIEVEE